MAKHPDRRTHKLCHAHIDIPDPYDPKVAGEIQLNAWMHRSPARVERTNEELRLGWVYYYIDIPLHILPQSQLDLVRAHGVITQVCGFPDAGAGSVLWQGEQRVPPGDGEAIRLEVRMSLI